MKKTERHFNFADGRSFEIIRQMVLEKYSRREWSAYRRNDRTYALNIALTEAELLSVLDYADTWAIEHTTSDTINIDFAKPTDRVEVETHYCKEADTTYLMEHIYNAKGDLLSREVIGFYSGEPSADNTAFYTKHRSVKAVYTLF